MKVSHLVYTMHSFCLCKLLREISINGENEGGGNQDEVNGEDIRGGSHLVRKVMCIKFPGWFIYRCQKERIMHIFLQEIIATCVALTW